MPRARGLCRLLGACLLGMAWATSALAQGGPSVTQSGGASAGAAAGDYTVGELAQRCAKAAPDFCYGYIIGSGQLYQQITRVGVVRGWACANLLPTLEQVRQVFVDWAGAHPTMANGAAVNGFWQAMSEHWPCKGK